MKPRGHDDIDRTTFLLALCESDRRHKTTKVASNITGNLESAISDLNRNLDWISFATHDLPLIRELPAVHFGNFPGKIFPRIGSGPRIVSGPKMKKVDDLPSTPPPGTRASAWPSSVRTV
jgi:hypothetical protein